MPKIPDDVYEYARGEIEPGTKIQTGPKVLVPDILLRDNYLDLAKATGCGTDMISPNPDLTLELRNMLGGDYRDVSLKWIGKRIVTCRKNPDQHGGWWTAFDRKGPSIGSRGGQKTIDELLGYLILLREELSGVLIELENVLERNMKKPSIAKKQSRAS